MTTRPVAEPREFHPVDAAQVLELVPTPVAVFTLDGRLLQGNECFRTLLAEEPEGRAGLGDALAAAQARLRDEGVTDAVDLGWFPAPSGEDVGCAVRLMASPTGQPTHFLVRVLDDGREGGSDPLTGLPSRTLLLERVQHAVSRSPRSRNLVELVVIDLDDFKAVNDTLGHTVGDQVLVEVARRLAESVRPADTVCRWGGDEFVVLLEDPQEVGGQALSRRVLEVLQAPVRISGDRTIHVAASCGWVQARDGEDAVALLHRADMRMYETKRARKNPTSPAQHHELQQRLARAHARSRLIGDVNRSVLATAQLRLDRAREALRATER